MAARAPSGAPGSTRAGPSRLIHAPQAFICSADCSGVNSVIGWAGPWYRNRYLLIGSPRVCGAAVEPGAFHRRGTAPTEPTNGWAGNRQPGTPIPRAGRPLPAPAPPPAAAAALAPPDAHDGQHCRRQRTGRGKCAFEDREARNTEQVDGVVAGRPPGDRG